MYACVYICMYISVYSKYVSVYKCSHETYINTYIYICTCVHTYVHMHTYLPIVSCGAKHDNAGCLGGPHHPPELQECGVHGSFSQYVLVGLVEAL